MYSTKMSLIGQYTVDDLEHQGYSQSEAYAYAFAQDRSREKCEVARRLSLIPQLNRMEPMDAGNLALTRALIERYPDRLDMASFDCDIAGTAAWAYLLRHVGLPVLRWHGEFPLWHANGQTLAPECAGMCALNLSIDSYRRLVYPHLWPLSIWQPGAPLDVGCVLKRIDHFLATGQ